MTSEKSSSQMIINFAVSAIGELAQMVERSLSMREVRGSIPRFSRFCFLFFLNRMLLKMKSDRVRSERPVNIVPLPFHRIVISPVGKPITILLTCRTVWTGYSSLPARH